MKISLARDALLAQLQTVSRVASTRSAIQALSGVQLSASEAGCELRATDMDVGIRVPVQAERYTCLPISSNRNFRDCITGCIFNPDAVAGLVRRCRAGLATGVGENQALVAILSTQLWHREFLDAPARARAAASSGTRQAAAGESIAA